MIKQGYYRSISLINIIYLAAHAHSSIAQDSSLNAIDVLRTKIMHSWSEVNIARAISSHSAEAFHHRIIKAYFDLYMALAAFASHRHEGHYKYYVTDELLPIYRIFKGLCISHDAWSAEQKKTATTISAYYLMHAIVHMWSFAIKGNASTSIEPIVDLLETEKNRELSCASPH